MKCNIVIFLLWCLLPLTDHCNNSVTVLDAQMLMCNINLSSRQSFCGSGVMWVSKVVQTDAGSSSWIYAQKMKFSILATCSLELVLVRMHCWRDAEEYCFLMTIVLFKLINVLLVFLFFYLINIDLHNAWIVVVLRTWK